MNIQQKQAKSKSSIQKDVKSYYFQYDYLNVCFNPLYHFLIVRIK